MGQGWRGWCHTTELVSLLLATLVSTLELVSLLNMGRMRKLEMAVSTLARDRAVSKLAPLPLGVLTILATAASTLVESSTIARGAGASAWYGLGGGMLGQSWQAYQSPRQFSI